MKEYYLSGSHGLILANDPRVPKGAREEDFVRLTKEEAEEISLVPEQYRWEAAQGCNWAPSEGFQKLMEQPEFEWLRRKYEDNWLLSDAPLNL